MQLRTARCKLGLRLFDVGRELRISADYLKLLEAGDFDQLPAPTYVSGFLRSYGKLVGLDAAELASRFYALQGSASAQMSYKLPVTGGPPQRSAPAKYAHHEQTGAPVGHRGDQPEILIVAPAAIAAAAATEAVSALLPFVDAALGQSQ